MHHALAPAVPWRDAFHLALTASLSTTPPTCAAYLPATGLSAASFGAWEIKAWEGAAVFLEASSSCNKKNTQHTA